jgi:hypothetical protein
MGVKGMRGSDGVPATEKIKRAVRAHAGNFEEKIA